MPVSERGADCRQTVDAAWRSAEPEMHFSIRYHQTSWYFAHEWNSRHIKCRLRLPSCHSSSQLLRHVNTRTGASGGAISWLHVLYCCVTSTLTNCATACVPVRPFVYGGWCWVYQLVTELTKYQLIVREPTSPPVICFYIRLDLINYDYYYI